MCHSVAVCCNEGCDSFAGVTTEDILRTYTRRMFAVCCSVALCCNQWHDSFVWIAIDDVREKGVAVCCSVLQWGIWLSRGCYKRGYAKDVHEQDVAVCCSVAACCSEGNDSFVGVITEDILRTYARRMLLTDLAWITARFSNADSFRYICGYLYVCAFLCMCIYMYVCMYIYIYICVDRYR